MEYLGPEWLELKAHAAREALRLGLEFTMHNCPGWSSSGGPWITPERGMQQLVWSETVVAGGAHARVRLPQPFQRLGHYRDVAVVAYPSLPGEAPLDRLLRSVTSGNDPVDVARLWGDASLRVPVRAERGDGATLRFEFDQPDQATSISFVTVPIAAAVGGEGGPPRRLQLEASDDGTIFRAVTTIDPNGMGGAPGAQVVAHFAPTTARYFRLQSPDSRDMLVPRFSGAAHIVDWAKKANIAFGVNGAAAGGADVPSASVIRRDTVIDLASHMKADGLLDWDAPAGSWTVLRFGHTALRMQNRSAPDTGIGLECDKVQQGSHRVSFQPDDGAPAARAGAAGRGGTRRPRNRQLRGRNAELDRGLPG